MTPDNILQKLLTGELTLPEAGHDLDQIGIRGGFVIKIVAYDYKKQKWLNIQREIGTVNPNIY